MAEISASKLTRPRQRHRAGAEGPTTKERDYLETIYHLAQRDEPVIAANVARWLGLQPPTVSHALQEMARKGFIQRDERGEIALTASGRALAEEVIRRHRMLECFLAEVVGVPWHLLNEEAAQLEPALSATLEERIARLVPDATVCPHGNPIPGSGAGHAGTARLDGAPAGVLFTIRRVDEEAEERTDLLRYLEANLLLPGAQFFIPDSSPAYGVTLRGCNRNITLSPEVAALIWGDPSAITSPK